jgi:hypothetical protein
MQFLLRKPYTSTMLLVFYAIFDHKGKKKFSLLKKDFLRGKSLKIKGKSLKSPRALRVTPRALT